MGINMIKLSKRDNRFLEEKAKNDISHIRSALKKEPLVLKKMKEYGFDYNVIDNVSIQFVEGLDVSAKTINGHIFLNAKMLEEDWKDYFHYACHEMVHVFQHLSGKCNGDNTDEEYLDNPSEIEAFRTQLEYREKTEPKKEVNEYINDLFDRHNVPKKERPEKKQELLDNK
jgi:hypothetical protein